MRIALFTETFLPKIDGVVTRITRTLDELKALGHEVLIFAPHNPPPEYKGFRVVQVPALPFKPWYPELFLGLPRPRLGRELDRFAPDVVHVVNPVILGLWGTAIAKQRNLPLLASYHTDITQYAVHLNLPLLGMVSRGFLRDVHNQAHVNLCTSQPMVNSAQGLGIRAVVAQGGGHEPVQLEQLKAEGPRGFPADEAEEVETHSGPSERATSQRVAVAVAAGQRAASERKRGRDELSEVQARAAALQARLATLHGVVK